jgi:hypothetical protein
MGQQLLLFLLLHFDLFILFFSAHFAAAAAPLSTHTHDDGHGRALASPLSGKQSSAFLFISLRVLSFMGESV